MINVDPFLFQRETLWSNLAESTDHYTQVQITTWRQNSWEVCDSDVERNE